MTGRRRRHGLKKETLLSHGSEGWEPTNRVSGVQTAVLSWYHHVVESRQEASKLSHLVLRALIPFMRASPSDLMTSHRPHLLTPSHWGVGFPHVTLKELGHSVHTTPSLCRLFSWLVVCLSPWSVSHLNIGNVAY